MSNIHDYDDLLFAYCLDVLHSSVTSIFVMVLLDNNLFNPLCLVHERVMNT